MAAHVVDPIVADEDVQGDLDSSIGEDATSSTASLSSSILDFRQENGRTYHGYKDGKYHLPNDDRENDRLDLQHNLFLLTFDNKLGLSPPNLPGSKVKRVLDLGTGTGIWAIDFGDDHPEAEVIGVDLSPIQPTFVPPNVRFIIDDIHEDWGFSEPFDYIHSRMMNFSIPDWPEYFRKIYENLAPGGYIEIQEIDVMMKSDDGTLPEDGPIMTWSKLLNESSIKLQQAYQKIDEFKDIMLKAGFIDIVDTRFKWPSNHWPKDKKYKELGVWNNENIAIALESLTIAPFTRAHGWSIEDVQVFLTEVRKDLNNPRIHGYWPICSVYGRKPLV
ncbi:S-adenosyl-L-methionine-dependent methyltransferase [Fusarium avenaceum]|nr:S-adenosyl-L-methionine-dependent methyltransferase [Fusarium avenaceum]